MNERTHWDFWKLEHGQVKVSSHDIGCLSKVVVGHIEAIAGYIQVRHPSQLYQALLEGLSLFAILLLLRLRLEFGIRNAW